MKPLKETSGLIPTLLGCVILALAIAYVLEPEQKAPPTQSAHAVPDELEDHPTHNDLAQESEPLPEETKSPVYVDSQANIEASDDLDFDNVRAIQRQQLQYLKEINPHNLMVPTEKTDQEVEQMLAEMELHRTLQQRIDDNTASDEERQQYVALHRQKLQEELELIRLCEDVAANSLEAEEVHQAQLCTRIVAAREQRLQAIEESLLALDELLTAQID